jgi:hypothetical protein
LRVPLTPAPAWATTPPSTSSRSAPRTASFSR